MGDFLIKDKLIDKMGGLVHAEIPARENGCHRVGRDILEILDIFFRTSDIVIDTRYSTCLSKI